MQITLNLKKKLEQSANEYFEGAKKARKKAETARGIVAKFKKDLEALEKKQLVEEKKVEIKRTAPKEWYEKFRWFTSSEGFLCIGGRDATSNEVVVKKHTDKDDILMHTEAPASPFFVIKTEGKKPSDITMQELTDGRVMCGAESAVKAHCKEYLLVKQGNDKPSDCAKKIARKLTVDIDEVLRVLPAGT